MAKHPLKPNLIQKMIYLFAGRLLQGTRTGKAKKPRLTGLALLITALMFALLLPWSGSAPVPNRVEAAGNADSITGWVIGNSNFTAAIFHTNNGGETWAEQGDPQSWQGINGHDISAANNSVAWAALGGGGRGKILYTKDGGMNWATQKEFNTDVKQIRALSDLIAWAVTIDGQVYRTTDGGNNWLPVSTGGLIIDQVNRMDAVGNSIWIADHGNDGDRLGQVAFSNDFGATWSSRELRPQEGVVGNGHNVSAYNEQIVWFAIWQETVLFRTDDGGNTIKIVNDGFAVNDLDGLFAPDENTLWLAQYLSTDVGAVYRAVYNPVSQRAEVNKMELLDDDGKKYAYAYGGVTCYPGNMVWVTGHNAGSDPEVEPKGIILHTTDGGNIWTRQDLPANANDVEVWKVSFAGERRMDNRADLAVLTLSQGTLSPAFSSLTTSYRTTVDYRAETLSVTATLADTEAALSINGSAATSGQARTINLNGPNSVTVFTVGVTAGDGITTRIYTIAVHQPPATQPPVPQPPLPDPHKPVPRPQPAEPEPDPEPEPGEGSEHEKGDLTGSGKIDVEDVSLAKQFVLGLKTLTPGQRAAADVNADGVIDVRDVIMIKKHTLGIISSF